MATHNGNTAESNGPVAEPPPPPPLRPPAPAPFLCTTGYARVDARLPHAGGVASKTDMLGGDAGGGSMALGMDDDGMGAAGAGWGDDDLDIPVRSPVSGGCIAVQRASTRHCGAIQPTTPIHWNHQVLV